MEIFNSKWLLSVVTKSKNKITLDTESYDVKINGLNVSYPWEYEKSWILLEVKEYCGQLFYSFTIDWNHLVIITNDNFELKEEILSFFGDVDILIIKWTKDSTKIYENIEAKLVIPFWEWKNIFLTNLWQHIEEIESYNIKWDYSIDSTEFINLAL